MADARLLQGLRATTMGFEADHAPLEAYLNLRPYAPVRAVRAAGGYVVRKEQEEVDLLLIRRRGLWDLPKGKCDDDEGRKLCAQREVGEEIGASDAEVLLSLGDTLHGYLDKGSYCLKTTRWFLMRTVATTFTPQAEEDITEVEWVPWEEAGRRLGFDTLRTHHRLVTPLVLDAFQ